MIVVRVSIYQAVRLRLRQHALERRDRWAGTEDHQDDLRDCVGHLWRDAPRGLFLGFAFRAMTFSPDSRTANRKPAELPAAMGVLARA